MSGRGVGKVGSTGSAYRTPRNLIRDKERAERENRAEQERREKAAWEAKRRRDERMTQHQIDHDTCVFREAKAELAAEKAGSKVSEPYGFKIYERELKKLGGINVPHDEDHEKRRKEINETKEFLRKNPGT